MAERTYTTRHADDVSFPAPIGPSEIDARVKRITVTDEGKISIALDGELADEAAVEELRNLLLAQRGPVSVTFQALAPEPGQ